MRPGRRTGISEFHFLFISMKISAAVLALPKIAPLAQAEQPGLSATPGRHKTPAPPRLWIKLSSKPPALRHEPLAVVLPVRSPPGRELTRV